ncbi:MAG: hypothetical protein ACRERE_39015 [Candidatus Entotheonellia bacterium]
MTHATADNLSQLLPAIYRLRDAEHNGVLKALLGIIAEQASAVEEDIARLYDNAFIETCDEWVVPYIGDLLGVRPLHAVGSNSSLRAYVANTLTYRRRKGTAPVLEQLARDVTGWTARAVEFFQLLGTTQHVNHVRPHNVCTPNLRDTNALEQLSGPFEPAAHTAEVRHIDSQRGRYNIPNIGLFLWRLQPYTFTGDQDARVMARAVVTPSDGRYTFNPFGLDAPLFNRPQTETEITHLAEEINVPDRLRRRPLYDELEAQRRALVDGGTPRAAYFGDTPVLQVFVDGSSIPISSDRVMIGDLSDLPTSPPGEWRRPPDSRTYRRFDGVELPLPIDVGVDPVLGRLAFPEGVTPSQVQVSYTYGFSGDVGGGPYDRRVSVGTILTRPITWQVGVSQTLPPVPDELFATLTDAVQAWNAQPAGTVGVIAVLDSLTYAEDLTGLNAIAIPEGSQLVLVAADWPEVDVPDVPGLTERIVGQLAPVGRRPHLLGDLAVIGTAPADSQSPGELVLHGLLVEGRLTVLAGGLGHLNVVHTTLVPGMGGCIVESLDSPPQQNSQLRISLERSICGPIALAESMTSLRLVDSIVDGTGGAAITAPGTACDISTSTVLGRASLHSLEASESIFTDTLMVERRQTGCVRFSYVPEASQTPRRYRCQPGLALKEVTNPAAQARIRARLRPSFTSTQYGHPAYAQLSRTCPEELRTGAEDGSEMGVFSHLKQPQREANLRASLEEYLRFGLEAGFFFVT